LIELMIVVAIVGILAAVALPAYRDYVTKVKVTEILFAASACRTTVAEGYQSSASSPGADAWGCERASGASKYAESISTDADGVITVTASLSSDLPEDVRGTTMQLVPTDSTGAPLTFTANATVGGFTCRPQTMPPKYLPGTCKG
jgi:type IV pilus assembly protein PilA